MVSQVVLDALTVLSLLQFPHASPARRRLRFGGTSIAAVSLDILSQVSMEIKTCRRCEPFLEEIGIEAGWTTN